MDKSFEPEILWSGIVSKHWKPSPCKCEIVWNVVQSLALLNRNNKNNNNEKDWFYQMMHGVSFFFVCIQATNSRRRNFISHYNCTHHNKYAVEWETKRCTFEVTNCFTYFVSGFCSKCHCVIYFRSLKIHRHHNPKLQWFPYHFRSLCMPTLSRSLYVRLLTNVSITLCLGKLQLQLQFLFSSLHHMHPIFSSQFEWKAKRSDTKWTHLHTYSQQRQQIAEKPLICT